ncbi:hypothetical protein X899_1123 [Burkholderia pseudomallei TSV 25]|nr:hypothetical protein X988_4105 [Burkholderia pseudomallei TSV 48]KGC12574.1 hypothetical protein DO64_3933 [Burkholderia pseudomallei]KGW07890.1 hypothetical protein X899_1123 [Burkholderia pseudomallei TSV 25]
MPQQRAKTERAIHFACATHWTPREGLCRMRCGWRLNVRSPYRNV